ncbi:hypothetical protein HLRTI_001413 [Halorhabdus tiamatea SARL4B]|uniref:ABC-2 type transport system permease protein n=1 Tax=Halorhabdus tiamatea SARL4B TaxID=1033806 RepID=S6D2M9_9EURY|nr:hypothetical protein HLRTI_001413 [Halorhabdus tiamatea SARL4B]CCQ35093.1 conserved hypothetical protein [Halorhabdus tiamatea SARL4B]
MAGGSLRIARAEWTRHRREFGTPLTGRPVLLVAVAAITLVLGWLAHSLGRDLTTGQPLPYELLSLLVSVTFVWMAWRSSQYTHARFERLSPDPLLTTVPARTATLGLLGFVYARLITTLALPTLGVAVGIAVGLRSPTVGITVLVAIAGIASLAVALGTTSRLAARLVALRLTRVRVYRDILIVFGWIPLMIGFMILQELSISLAPLLAVFGALPLAWFVDLALLGSVESSFGSVGHAFGALGLLVLTVPVLVAGSTVFARRIWESEPVSSVGSTGSSGSHSLLKEGVLERFVGDRIPRAAYTVARERWLLERRGPRGLLMSGYVVFLVGMFGFPAVAIGGGGPNGLLLLFAVGLGMMAGIAFASAPIGTEYRTLPMLFTTVDGQQFAGGLVLAATTVGAPLVLLVIVPLGISSLVGTIQTIVIALVGVTVSTCTASVALAIGMGVERYDYTPMSSFFTDIPVYAEIGLNGFLRLGSIFAVVTLVTVPAFLGNAPPVYERVEALGIPALGVQIGSLFLTLLLVVAVTRIAFRIAVQRFRDYQIG